MGFRPEPEDGGEERGVTAAFLTEPRGQGGKIELEPLHPLGGEVAGNEPLPPRRIGQVPEGPGPQVDVIEEIRFVTEPDAGVAVQHRPQQGGAAPGRTDDEDRLEPVRHGRPDR